jgi:site-specific DNA-cytosine methylase
VGVCVKDENDDYVGMYNYVKSDNFMQGKNRFQPGKEISSAILAGSPPEAVVTRDLDEPKVLGGIGEKKSNGGTQWYQQDRIYDDNVALAVTTVCNPYYKSGLRIRKLTGKEAYRLMGFSDEDCDNARKVLSEAMIYHTAGDSICVSVLEAIFKQLL